MTEMQCKVLNVVHYRVQYKVQYRLSNTVQYKISNTVQYKISDTVQYKVQYRMSNAVQYGVGNMSYMKSSVRYSMCLSSLVQLRAKCLETDVISFVPASNRLILYARTHL